MARRKKQSNHSSFLTHGNFVFLWAALIICAIGIIGYVWNDFYPVRNGGTWYGYTLGVIATILIVWLALLGVRKRVISEGNWSLKAWTSAHVYLGLSLIIIATLHTGFQFGWNIHTLAYALMMGVIISGIFGIYYYVTLPGRMSDNRGEMSQVMMLDELDNLDRMLRDTARPLYDHYIERVRVCINETKVGGGILSRLSEEHRGCATRKTLDYFRIELPEVDEGMRTPVLDVISVLERKNALLRRIRRHIRFKTLLGLWLYFHVPLTFALFAALTAHIISVFFYS